MDFGNGQKVSAVVGITIIPRGDVVATQGSVKVELPPEKTVQSAGAGDAIRVDISDRAAELAPQRREISTENADRQRRQEPLRTASPERQNPRPAIDQPIQLDTRTRIELATKTVVIEKTDPRTGETVQLVPDETTLKLRVLARANAQREREISDATARLIERSA